MGKKGKGSRVGKRVRKRRGFWIGTSIVAIVIGLFAWGRVGTKSSTGITHTVHGAPSGYARRETRIPLSPALFVGKTAVAYRVAHEIPDVLDQLYCYCYCDKNMGHRTLLTCFVNSHAAT